MPSLLPFAFAAASGSDLVLLDVREDAYALVVDAVRPSGAEEQVLLPLGVHLTEAASTILEEAGLVDHAAIDSVPRLEAPTTSLSRVRGTSRSPAPRDLLDLAAAAAKSRARLRRGMPCSTYRRSRCTTAASEHVIVDALSALEVARLFLPTATRCLPASLITSFFLERRGVPSEIVFGVRTHPFAAHCWVEVGGVLIDDELDRVRAYRPICVGSP